MELGCCKIGISCSPFSRLDSFQTANPHNPVVMELLWFRNQQDARDVEARLHGHLKAYNMVGEWFSPDLFPEILEKVAFGCERHKFYAIDEDGIYLLEQPIIEVVP